MTTISQTGASIYEQLNLTQPEPETTDNETLGQSDFLELMTTQLQNQDPFAPLENGEFIGQMAQFGTVTGIESLQESFDSLGAALQSNRALEASVMVGREVLVPSAVGNLADGGVVRGGIELPSAANNTTVKVYNTAGELVSSQALGSDGAGITHFEWDGLDSEGNPAPPGAYLIEAEAQIGTNVEQLGTYIAGNVDSVTLGNGLNDFTLHVDGIGDVRIDDVVQIT
ncbi:MAG: flagellar hook assembly protein FlgD [Pseudomonadota bacterium]